MKIILKFLHFLDLTHNDQLDLQTVVVVVILVKMATSPALDWSSVCLLLGSLVAHQTRHNGDKG